MFFHVCFLPSLLFQTHGISGHVGTTIVTSGHVGEGARGRCHHGLRSFSPRLMRSTVPTVQAGNKIWQVTAHAAVVSSAAWAGRLFSVTRIQLSKGFWSSLQKPQNTILERFGFYMSICWFPLCSSWIRFSSVGWFEKDPVSAHFHGTSWGEIQPETEHDDNSTWTFGRSIWSNQCWTKRYSELSGQIKATSHDLGPQNVAGREISLFQWNLG